MKKNKLKLGLGMLTVLATPIAVNTVAGTEVHAAQGWVQSGSSWYYYHQEQLVKNAWVGSYWLGADGKMVTNSWVDNGRYYVGTNGVWDKTVKKQVLLKSVENKVPTRGYANGVYYVDSKPANWWYDDGEAWYFFQNGKKLTGYGKDNAGTHYFVNGKYANGKIENKEYRDGKEISAENKVPTRGYANGVYYVDSKAANWWYDDGEAWYFFQNGRKLTGYGKDNAGLHYFVNGKYAVDKDKNTKRSIFLDPGHGGSDPGAIMSSKLASLGYTVLTSRNVDKDVDLVDRADQANKANADMLLSIHFNAGGRGIARGIETYYYQATADRVPKINKENHNNAERLERSRKLANKVQQNLLYQTGANDRGVKRASFTVLRETSIPSILVELGFIDNPEERNKIKTNEYQERLANGIVDGIVAYYK